MTEDLRAMLNELPNTAHGQALGLYLREKYEEMNSVENCKTWEETLGKQYAIKLLKEMFKFMKPDTIIIKSKNPYM